MNTSNHLFRRGRQVIPGGVNSPVRAFQAVGTDPVYMARGRGAHIVTVDGRELLDLCGSWGPLILGHAREEVIAAVVRAARAGTTFGANTAAEVEFAELLCEMVPSLDMVRTLTSGTEAAMTAVRLARGITGRRKILKFDGCYHGHADPFLVSAGSGLLTGGIASSAGVTEAVARDVLVAPYNDMEAVGRIARAHADDLAAIIVEPVAGNMGLVLPVQGFLAGLREAADRSGALLIFDEVITGFRLAPTTYGTLCGVVPDLTCLGKIIGGGLPMGAVGGRRAVMQRLAPQGDVYQAGTLSGNPLAMAAGIAALRLLREENPYPRLEALGARLGEGLDAAARAHGVSAHCARTGSMFTFFFRSAPVRRREHAVQADTQAFARFFRGMLAKGCYLPPSQFEVGFLSTAHTEKEVDRFVASAGKVLATFCASGAPRRV